MQIQIQAKDFPLTESLVDYIERSIHYALSSRHSQIRRIAMRLSAVKRLRGRVDKHCQVQVSLPRSRTIEVEDSGQDIYVAIESAIYRADLAINHRLKRQLFKKRKLFIPRAKSLVLSSGQ